HAVKRRVEIVGRTLELRRVKLQTQRFRRALCCRECFRRACIPENGQSCPCWEGFREQLDAFLRQFRLPVEQSRDTTAGPRQARYVAARDRVIIVGEDDDWNAGARRDCGLQRQFGAARHNDRYVRARHRSRIGESPVRTLVGTAIVDDEVAALGEPELLQFGDKGPISQSTGDGVVEPGVEHADAGDLRGRLLRARRERPRGCRAAERDQQFPPFDCDCHTPLPREARKGKNTTARACSLAVSRRQDAGCCRPAAGRKRKGSVFRFAPESGQSNLLRAVQDHGLRRENDKAYAPSRMSIKGSSDSSIPSVSWPGRKSNFFSASVLSGTTLSTVKTPSSATLRSSGQATDGSLVESPAAASCAFRVNVIVPCLCRSGSSTIRKFGGCFAASEAERCTRCSATN